MTFDVSTHIVSSNNETMEWCNNIIKDLDGYQYRPMTEILAASNFHLNSVMHHRPHQQEY